MKKKVGPYILDQKIADCACGEVYKSIMLNSESEFCIKMLSKSRITPQELACSEREVEILGILNNHPNIAKLIDIKKSDKNYYLIYDYYNGKTLDEFIKNGTLNAKMIRQVSEQLLNALNYVHANGTIHRNLKLSKIFLHYENIDLKENFLVKLSGFRHSCNINANNLNSTEYYGDYINTAPEILKNMPHSVKSDIWSFGLIVYELAFGEPMFKGKTREELLENIEKGYYKIPSKIQEFELLKLIEKCVKYDAEKRPSLSEILNYEFFTKNTDKETKFEIQKFILKNQLKEENGFILFDMRKDYNYDLDLSLSKSSENNNNKSGSVVCEEKPIHELWTDPAFDDLESWKINSPKKIEENDKTEQKIEIPQQQNQNKIKEIPLKIEKPVSLEKPNLEEQKIIEKPIEIKKEEKIQETTLISEHEAEKKEEKILQIEEKKVIKIEETKKELEKSPPLENLNPFNNSDKEEDIIHKEKSKIIENYMSSPKSPYKILTKSTRMSLKQNFRRKSEEEADSFEAISIESLVLIENESQKLKEKMLETACKDYECKLQGKIELNENHFG